ncbi:MAG: fibronectin type III domain-containing protein [Actinomycetota bacterium]|nr:fibronectin type III domain-containing protein [Actinomycetota bacterium]
MAQHVSRPTGVAMAAALLIGIAAVNWTPSPRAGAASKPIRLSEATMIVEVNATDGDAGLQVFLDGEPWRSMEIADPDGERILAVKTKRHLRDHGLTELFSESSEPSFKELPLRKFKKLFPEGRYTFRGTTIEGRRLVGSAKLSHDIPDGPNITSPAEDASVSKDNAVADWDPVAESGGIDITGYRAIVEREDPLRVFSVDLPASVTGVTIPAEFLESGTDYKLEVQAIEASGNQTLTESEFRVV